MSPRAAAPGGRQGARVVRVGDEQTAAPATFLVKPRATTDRCQNHPTPSVELIVAVRTVSEANAHEHWRVRQRRAKAQRFAATMVMLTAKGRFPALPVTVTLIRVAPRELDDDNLVGSQKHVRDGIADALGVNDRDPRVRWRYDQRRGAPKTYTVVVRIEPQEAS